MADDWTGEGCCVTTPQRGFMEGEERREERAEGTTGHEESNTIPPAVESDSLKTVFYLLFCCILSLRSPLLTDATCVVLCCVVLCSAAQRISQQEHPSPYSKRGRHTHGERGRHTHGERGRHDTGHPVSNSSSTRQLLVPPVQTLTTRSACWATVQLSTAQYSSVQLSTAQYSSLQLTTAQCGAVQLSTVQHSTAQHSSAQLSTAQYSSLQHSAVQYSSVQYSTVQLSTAQHSSVQHSTAHYSSLQLSTAQYSTVQLRNCPRSTPPCPLPAPHHYIDTLTRQHIIQYIHINDSRVTAGESEYAVYGRS